MEDNKQEQQKPNKMSERLKRGIAVALTAGASLMGGARAAGAQEQDVAAALRSTDRIITPGEMASLKDSYGPISSFKESQEKEVSPIIAGLQGATPTEAEAKTLNERFNTTEKRYFGTTEIGPKDSFVNPYEKDSAADKQLQRLLPFIGIAQNSGLTTVLFTIRDTDKNFLSHGIRIEGKVNLAVGDGNTKDFTNIALAVDSNGKMRYIEPLTPDGVAGFIWADELDDSTTGYSLAGRPISVEEGAVVTMGEYIPKIGTEQSTGDVVTVLAQEEGSIPFKKIPGLETPTATPGPGSKQVSVVTVLPQEVEQYKIVPEFNPNAVIEVSRDRKTITVDGKAYPVIPLPKNFNLVGPVGKEKINPPLGVYETGFKTPNYDIIGIVVGTHMRNFEGVNLPVIDVVTFQSNGKVKKVELIYLPVVNLDGKIMSWDDAKRELTPGRVIDTGPNLLETEKTYDDKTLQDGVEGFKKLGFDLDVATLKTWNSTGKGALNILKNFNNNNSTDWIRIGMGWGIRTKPN